MGRLDTTAPKGQESDNIEIYDPASEAIRNMRFVIAGMPERLPPKARAGTGHPAQQPGLKTGPL